MIYLLIAIICSVTISMLMRLSEKHVKNEMAMFTANYAICSLLSIINMQDKTQLLGLAYRSGNLTIVLGIIAGLLYLVSFVFLKVNMKHNGIVLPSIFMKLGILVPTVLAVVVFRETPKWTQVLGIIVAAVAIILIKFEKDSLTESKNKTWLVLLLLLSGFAEAMATIYDKIGDAGMKDAYLFVTFGTAFVVALSLALKGRDGVGGKDLLFGACIGVPNYFFSKFLLQALESIPALIVYPTYSVTSIIIITLLGIVVFREAVSRRKLCALGLILLALVFLNV